MRLKSTSKEKRQGFVDRLETLFQDPTVIVPTCVDGGMFCQFKSYEKKLAALASSGNYERYARSQDQILSGFSETHRAMDSESSALFAVLKTHFGSIEYAKRGGATDDNVLAGIQHFDDPLWRMLAYSSLAKSKGVRVYSSRNYYIGSCRNTSPGVEFFQDLLNDEGVQFESDGSTITVGNSGHQMVISHLSSVSIIVRENSVLNTVNLILKHTLTPDIGGDFTFSMDYLESTIPQLPDKSLNLYLQGKINDRTFIRDTVDFRTAQAVKKGSFVIGGEAFDSPAELVARYPFKYVPDDKIVEILGNFRKGFQMDTFSERKVLEIVWPTHRTEILTALHPEGDDSMFSGLKGSPIDQIEALHGSARTQSIRSSVEVSGWSPDSQFLVDLILDFFAEGKEKSIRNAEKNLGSSSIRKALFYAFLDCIGESRNREWQFSDIEKDLAWKVRDPVCRTLNSGPESLAQELESIRVFVK